MKIYEIANPSDAYTLEADNFLVAAVAVALLGNGAYGIEGTPCLFGWDAWLKEHVPQGVNAFIDANAEAMAAVLDSVMIGSETDRKNYHKALGLIDNPAKREEWKLHWHDERRSSLNDIGSRAWALAKKLRGLPVSVPKDGCIIAVA